MFHDLIKIYLSIQPRLDLYQLNIILTIIRIHSLFPMTNINVYTFDKLFTPMLCLKLKLSYQKANFVPREHEIYHRVPSIFRFHQGVY